jgi:hypothetical protein
MIMRYLTLALTCLLSSSAGLADSVIPADYSPASYSVDVRSSVFGTDTQLGPSTVTASVGEPLPFPKTPGLALAQAIAGPNDLGVYGGASASSSGSASAGTNVRSLGYFIDNLFLTDGPSTGFLRIAVDVRGDSTILNYGNGYAVADTELRFYLGGTGGPCASLVSDGSYTGCEPLEDGLNYFLVQYEPYDLLLGHTLELEEEFITSDSCDAEAGLGYNACFGQASYTAQIASITVDDAHGNAISGATVTSLSGVDYSLPQAATPEPSSFILLGTGMLCLVVKMRRKLLWLS